MRGAGSIRNDGPAHGCPGQRLLQLGVLADVLLRAVREQQLAEVAQRDDEVELRRGGAARYRLQPVPRTAHRCGRYGLGC